MNIKCSACGADHSFDQPYAYHAGFGNTGFLYSDSGLLVLTWSSFDPAYERVVGKVHPWGLSPAQRSELETRLTPAPDGGRWRFENPARCSRCGTPISGSILTTIYYVVPEGSIDLDGNEETKRFTFANVLAMEDQ
jgi:hypothetical protein